MSSLLLPPELLRDLFCACGPDERQRTLLAEIEEALRTSQKSRSDDADDERLQLAALAAARVAALTEEEGAALLSSQLLLLEPLALGVRLEAGAVTRLLEACRRRRRRSGKSEEKELLLLERAAVAASTRLAPLRPAEKEEEEEEEQASEREAEDGPSSSLVRWSTESGASVSFEARSWRRRTATRATAAKKKDEGGDGEDSLLRGAAATRDISPGEEIARIPSENLVHARMLPSTDAGRAIGALKLPDEEQALLAFTLLDAADADSPRAPLWDSLRGQGGGAPSSSYSLRTALNATEGEIALIDERAPARRLAARAAEHAAAAARAAAPLLSALRRAFGPRVRAELLPGVASFSEEAYRWAMAVWYAYAIEADIGSGDGEEGGGGGGGGESDNGEEEREGSATTTTTSTVPCLAPPLFLLNHSPHPHCVSYALEEEDEEEEEEEGDDEKEGANNTRNRRRFLVARSCRSAKKGEQLFLSYGRLLSKSAAHSLCYYGFVVPSGKDPDAALEVDLLNGLLSSLPERGGGAAEGKGKGKGETEGGEGSAILPPPGLETRHFLRATTTGAQQLPPAVLSAAREVALLHAASSGGGGGGGGADPLSPGEVARRAVAAARVALAATAERAEGAIKAGDSSSSPFVLAILEYARSGVELADRVAAGALGW